MKNFILALLYFAMPSLYAQHTITGTITDQVTNEGIPFSNVYFPQLEIGTISTEEGTYILKNLPAGTYKLVCSIIGYETQSIRIDIPLTSILDITLVPTAIEMEQIIISTPFHKLQSENVMKVEQLKASDLKANGALSLSDGITSIAGVKSISTGVSIGKPVIRGLSSNRVLVYTQGVRLENQQFGDEHGLGINAAGIESVEIIKGPASLLYGSDALGGVLYINPERFAKENSRQGDLHFDYFNNTQGFNINTGYKASKAKLKYLFRVSHTEHSDYKNKSYRVTNTRFIEQDFKSGIGYQNINFKTELRYNGTHSKLGIPEGINEQTTLKTPLFPFQEITNHIFSSKSTLFFNSSSLDLNVGYLYNNRKEFEEQHDELEEIDVNHTGSEAALHLKLKTISYDLKYNLPVLGRFESIIGIQGMNQKNTNYGEEQLIPNATTNDFGILATSHVHFNAIDLQLGARFDQRSIAINSNSKNHYNSFNSAIGLKTNIFTSITTRLNFASGFRAPNLAELTSYGTHEGTNRFEIGNENLKNEKNIQLDLALEFKNDHLELFGNLFYNRIKDYIFLSPDGSQIENTPVYVYLQENASLYGGEFGLHLHPHPLDWLHIESSFESVIGQQDNHDYLPLIPANSITNTIRIEWDSKWSDGNYAFIKLNSSLKQKNVSGFETSTQGYSVLSIGIGSELQVLNRELTLRFSVNNLTNERYINHLSRLKSDGIYNIGRQIHFGLSYKI